MRGKIDVTSETSQLWISLNRSDGADLVSLARRSSATRQALALHAVRLMLASERGGVMPELPTLDPGDELVDSAGVWITLAANETAALDILAGRLSVTPKELGRAAVLQMLKTAKDSAVPMLKAVEPQPLEDREPSSALAAKVNFSKAMLIVDRLHHISEFGFDEASRAALADIETLKTIPPY